ncbi:unnamed protein product [Heterobilharzia americana]|nr:unnamed protein product [Heterobilharzia americana]CAH8608634.1 unnamed protein product [Heterobilharzia americana]
MLRKRPSFMVQDILRETDDKPLKHWQLQSIFNLQTNEDFFIHNSNNSDNSSAATTATTTNATNIDDISSICRLYQKKSNMLNDQYDKWCPSEILNTNSNEWDQHPNDAKRSVLLNNTKDGGELFVKWTSFL